MSRQKVCLYQRKVAASVSLQYLIEASELNMSLSAYIQWLKRKAKYITKYDNLEERGTRLAERLMEV